MKCDFLKRWSFPHSVSPVLLEQKEEGSPCVLVLQCGPCSPSAISRLLVISEARTMEVYNQTGEYCGTVRGEREDGIQIDRYTHRYTVLTSFACLTSYFLIYRKSIFQFHLCWFQINNFPIQSEFDWCVMKCWSCVSSLLCSQFRQRAFL